MQVIGIVPKGDCYPKVNLLVQFEDVEEFFVVAVSCGVILGHDRDDLQISDVCLTKESRTL